MTRWMRQGMARGMNCGYIAAIAVAAALTAGATAGERRFAYSYEATTHQPGTVEYEQFVTWKTDKDSDSEFERIDFRHELEFGLTEKLQLGLYLSDWRYQEDSSGSETTWKDVAVELIYALSDPALDPFGVALYGEVKYGDELFELEGKIIVQKNIGKWVFAWNGTIEAEWEGSDYQDDKGELAQTLGASYQLSPTLLAGVELLHEVEYADWSEWQDHVVYVGPNLSWRTDSWWLTVAPLFQITDVNSEPNLQTRFIFGFDF